MKITILTLFPRMFEGVLGESIIKRAQAKGVVKITTRTLRDWTADQHKTVDDRPYGGGAGMVLKVDVIYRALKDIAKIHRLKKERDTWVVLPTPKGKKFDQAMARRLAKKKHLVFICPHYEGYDERVTDLVDEEVSLGDFIMTGGEIPVMAMTDAIVRLLPGAIKADSLKDETFSMGGQGKRQKAKGKSGSAKASHKLLPTASDLLPAPTFEYPQYTRPEVFEAVISGKKKSKRVPKILLSGNHASIKAWRAGKSR